MLQQRVSHDQRVIHIFHRDGVLPDVFHPEIVGLRTRCDHEPVVVQFSVAQYYFVVRSIHTLQFAHTEMDIRIFPEQLAKGITDVGILQETRGYLVNKRRKKIVIVLIDKGDLNVRIILQLQCEIDTSESSPDDHQLF
jgi:hypothetical protein